MIRRPSAAVAVLGTLLSATFLTAPPASAASTPTQVALLVQKTPGGPLITRCVDSTSGMSGATVFARSGVAVGYGTGSKAGFVLTIDGYGTSTTSDSRYWSYWRSTGGDGAFSYSNVGVGSSRPGAGSVEAWVYYDNGPVDFPHDTYASICPNGYAAAAPPAAPTAAAPAPTSAAAAGGASSGSGGGGGSRTTGPTGPNRGGSSSGAPADEGSAGPSTTVTASDGATPGATTSGPVATSTGPSPTASPDGSTRSVAASDVASTSSTGAGTGVTIGLVVAVVAVVGLGGAAVVVRRRRASEQ